MHSPFAFLRNLGIVSTLTSDNTGYFELHNSMVFRPKFRRRKPFGTFWYLHALFFQVFRPNNVTDSYSLFQFLEEEIYLCHESASGLNFVAPFCVRSIRAGRLTHHVRRSEQINVQDTHSYALIFLKATKLASHTKSKSGAGNIELHRLFKSSTTIFSLHLNSKLHYHLICYLSTLSLHR